MKKMEENELYDLADFFKVFGDSSRLKIMLSLLDGEQNVNEIADELQMTQSAISHQLKILKLNRLVKTRRDGKSVFYSLADDHVRLIIEMGREHIGEP